jgi:hypothetical protein
MHLATALLLLSAPAQSDFQAGDLYLSSRALADPASPGGSVSGVLRIDPFTGDTQQVVFDVVGVSWPTIAFDPYRDRLLLSSRIGPLGTTSDPAGLWAVDAAGGAVLLVENDAGYRGIAPVGDGRVYLSSDETGEKTRIQWLDAAGALHVLLDASGTAPFEFDPMYGQAPVELLYDAATQSLLAASDDQQYPCPGMPPTGGLNLRRLPLTADGSRLAGPVACVQYDAGDEHQHLKGVTRGPDGSAMVGVWTNGGVFSRALLLDPATMAVAVHSGASPSPHATAYSRTRARAAVLNTGQNTISLYAPGETGLGTTLSSDDVSAPFSSGERASLVEIEGPWSNSGLSAATGAVSVGGGGAQAWTLDVGDTLAGLPYLIGGSIGGWSPGFAFGGVSVPLVPDAYTKLTLTHPGSPLLPGTLGVLGPGGTAQAAFVLPAGSDPALVGLVLHHAGVVLAPGFAAAAWATNPVPLELVP